MTLRDETEALQARVDGLAAREAALTGRRAAVDGYDRTAPLSGAERFHEFAGLATGGAIVGVVDAGKGAVKQTVLGVARAKGPAETIGALLDLAAASLAWATVLSLEDAERGAQTTAWRDRSDVGPILELQKAGIRDLRRGVIHPRDLLIGTIRPSIARALGRATWDTLLQEAGFPIARVSSVAVESGVELGSRLADLDAPKRSLILSAVGGEW